MVDNKRYNYRGVEGSSLGVGRVAKFFEVFKNSFTKQFNIGFQEVKPCRRISKERVGIIKDKWGYVVERGSFVGVVEALSKV